LEVHDRFFRSRQADSKDRFILTRISGSKRSIILDAEPQSFQERFPNPDTLRQYILSLPDPGGSRVFDSLKDSADYLVLQHKNNRKLKSVLLAWTDLDNNVSDGPNSKEQLVESLREYAHVGGHVAFYGVLLDYVPEWSRILKDCGFKSYVIEPDVRENFKLPVLD
jgi:hypothetical protein